MHAQEYTDKFRLAVGQNTKFSKKISSLQALVSVLIEQSNLANEVVLQDLAGRERLSDALRLSSLPNDGYLMLEKCQMEQTRSKQDHEGGAISPLTK